MAHYVLNPYAIPPAVTTAAMLLLGAWVLVRERFSPVSRLFGLTIATIAVWLFAFSWMYCATDPRTALWWAKVAYLGVPLIPSSIYHFTVTVLRIGSRRRMAVRLSWSASVFFSVAILSTDTLIHDVFRYWWGYYPQYGWLSVPYLIFFFGLMIVSLRHYWQAYRDTAPGTVQQRRTRSLLVAFSIVYLGSFDYVAKYGIPLYPFGYLPVTVFIVLLTRVLWRYRLVDITAEFAAKSIINTMVNPLLVLDHEGVIRIVNHAACQLFGQPAAALVGKPVTAAHPDFLTPARLEELTRYKSIQHYELPLTVPPAQTRVLSLSASVLHDQEQRPMGIVCILTDITERNRAEEQLKRAHAQLQKSHKELKATHLQLIQAAKMESVGRLAAGVAHEVKNPLAIILQGIDFLSKHLGERDGNTALVLRYTSDAVRRADGVIRGLLDFSTSRKLELTPSDFNEVIEHAVLLVKHELDRSHVQVVKMLAPELPPVPMDRNKMAQVFVNLFLNAIFAMPSGGTLTVTTQAKRLDTVGPEVGLRRDDRFKLGDPVIMAEVSDTGSGISEDALQKIFDPFFTTKPSGQGTGLGLTVAKKIIELHGGFLEIGNQPEGGVKATVALRVKGGERAWRKSASFSSMTR